MNIRIRRSGSSGQILAGMVVLMVVLLVFVAAITNWGKYESVISVHDSQNTLALNLAQGAVDRGFWEVKNATINVTDVLNGVQIPGYHFDTTFTDPASGGTYRIYLSSAANKTIVVQAEGRDPASKVTRAITASFQNTTIYSPLLAEGNVTWDKGLGLYWGPVMSQGDLKIVSDFVAQLYFPLKYAKGVVQGTALNPRDTSWPNPPHTDNLEWWDNYRQIPELPVIDFNALRSSAAATHTLNVYGDALSAQHTDPVTGLTVAGPAPWDARFNGSDTRCATKCCSTGSHNLHFGNSWNHPKSAKNDPNTDYVWFWDGDVTFAGDNSIFQGRGFGLRGIVVVMGNLTLDAGGEYKFTGPVPANAWIQHQRSDKTHFDTAATGQYPADNGLHTNKATFNFGTDSWCETPTNCGWVSTPGMRGFTYVAKNFNIIQFMDFVGAVWVNGTVTATQASLQTKCGIFYNDQLTVPTLNVILTQTSWQEVPPSKALWQ